MSKASLELGGGNWGTKDGNLLGYAQGTSSSKFVPREFTFSRGSNLAATRVAANGLIEKGRENLLLQSNQFDTTWIRSNASVTGGQSGYDGNDAWLLDIVSGTNSQRIEQSISQSGVQTYSVYVKKGTLNWVRIRVNATVTAQSYFDLENGVVGTIQAGLISRSIESVGNGWFRCSIVFNSTSSLVRIYPANDDGSVTQSSGNIYIQDAQLEAGMVATNYIETGASTVKAGILENTPRLDYSGGATEPSLLLEPSRTNLIGHSEYFGDSSWIKSASTITNNALTSPQGSNNASYLTDDTANNFHGLYTIKNVSSDFTCSIFVKYDNKQFVSFLSNNNGASDRYAYFDLINKTTHTISSGLTASVEDVGNGWLRLSVMGVSSASGYYWWNIAASNSTTAYVGDGTGRVGIYGAQLEAGSYATSYIPTYGSSETRSEDVSTQLNFSNFFDGYDFTMFLELKDNDSLVRADSSNNFRISDAGGINYGAIRIYRASAGSTRHRVVFQDNSQNFNPSSVLVDGDNPKVVVRRIYNTGEFKVFVNGVLELTATNTDYDMFRFIDFAGGGSSMNIKQFALFGTALSDADCITLTTL